MITNIFCYNFVNMRVVNGYTLFTTNEQVSVIHDIHYMSECLASFKIADVMYTTIFTVDFKIIMLEHDDFISIKRRRR